MGDDADQVTVATITMTAGNAFLPGLAGSPKPEANAEVLLASEDTSLLVLHVSAQITATPASLSGHVSLSARE